MGAHAVQLFMYLCICAITLLFVSVSAAFVSFVVSAVRPKLVRIGYMLPRPTSPTTPPCRPMSPSSALWNRRFPPFILFCASRVAYCFYLDIFRFSILLCFFSKLFSFQFHFAFCANISINCPIVQTKTETA